MNELFLIVGLLVFVLFLYTIYKDQSQIWHERSVEIINMAHRHQLENKQSGIVRLADGLAVSYDDVMNPATTAPVLNALPMYYRSKWQTNDAPNSYHDKRQMIDGEYQRIGEDEYTDENSFFVVPDFPEMWENNQLPTNGKMLLGFSSEDAEPIIKSTSEIGTVAIVGQSGMGKSTLTRLLICQGLLHGHKYMIADPHLDAGEESLGASLQPLGEHLAAPVASRPDAINSMFAYVLSIIDARLNGKDQDRTPITVFADEFNGILMNEETQKSAEALAVKCATESRKVNVSLVCLAQSLHSDFMPSSIRNTFHGAIILPGHRDMAGNFIATSQKQLIEELEIGDAIFAKIGHQAVRFVFPNTTADDMVSVAGATLSRPSPDPLPLLEGGRPETPPETFGNHLGDMAETADYTDLTIMNLIRDGKSKTAIYNQVYRDGTASLRKVNAYEHIGHLMEQVANENNNRHGHQA